MRGVMSADEAEEGEEEEGEEVLGEVKEVRMRRSSGEGCERIVWEGWCTGSSRRRRR